MQYYKPEDIRLVVVNTGQQSDINSCKEHTFTLTLPPCDGLEYAPGVFAALSEEEKSKFIDAVKKFQG